MSPPRPRPALVVVVAAFGAAFVSSLVLFADASIVITPAKVAAPQMPDLVSERALCLTRCLMLAANVFATVVKLSKVEDKVIKHQVPWGSKLTPLVRIRISGPRWATFFTFQAWTLQFVYLLGASACSLDAIFSLGLPLSNAFATFLWMAYEVSFSVAILTSFIVKYVLIPTMVKKGSSVANFFNVEDLLMHNANTLFMALELLFNDLPFILAHFPLAALFGLVYVLFSWAWLASSGCVWYDFLDPTLPKACAIHVALVSVLGVFFAIGVGFAQAASMIASPLLRVAVVLAGVAAVARTGLLTGIPQPEHLAASNPWGAAEAAPVTGRRSARKAPAKPAKAAEAEAAAPDAKKTPSRRRAASKSPARKPQTPKPSPPRPKNYLK